MVDTQAKTNSDSVEDMFSSAHLELVDLTVTEVFGMMLGLSVQRSLMGAECCLNEQNERTAIVGFSGAMRGSCGIRLSSAAATAVASAMLGGAPVSQDDGSIEDAVGELCNMLAGGWKGRIPELSSHCLLSSPAVISGSDYRVCMKSASIAVSRIYSFEGQMLHLTLVRERLATS